MSSTGRVKSGTPLRGGPKSGVGKVCGGIVGSRYGLFCRIQITVFVNGVAGVHSNAFDLGAGQSPIIGKIRLGVLSAVEVFVGRVKQTIGGTLTKAPELKEAPSDQSAGLLRFCKAT